MISYHSCRIVFATRRVEGVRDDTLLSLALTLHSILYPQLCVVYTYNNKYYYYRYCRLYDYIVLPGLVSASTR